MQNEAAPIISPNWREHVRRAIELAGGHLEFARRAGMNRNTAHRALNNLRKPTIELGVAAAKTSGGEVKIADMFPGVVEAVKAELERAAE